MGGGKLDIGISLKIQIKNPNNIGDGASLVSIHPAVKIIIKSVSLSEHSVCILSVYVA